MKKQRALDSEKSSAVSQHAHCVMSWTWPRLTETTIPVFRSLDFQLCNKRSSFYSAIAIFGCFGPPFKKNQLCQQRIRVSNNVSKFPLEWPCKVKVSVLSKCCLCRVVGHTTTLGFAGDLKNWRWIIKYYFRLLDTRKISIFSRNPWLESDKKIEIPIWLNFNISCAEWL